MAGETGGDIKPTLHYLYKNGIGGILDYAAEDDVQSEGGPASREPENEHIIARTFDYESEVGVLIPAGLTPTSGWCKNQYGLKAYSQSLQVVGSSSLCMHAGQV